ncbi:MAG: response regulator transcription factor [Deltaproteobacteria bacterium]|nr:response regulator transcription factor [Deltaproteobacteria bacterium]
MDSGEQAGKVRILMIDDDRKLCRLVGDYLSKMGFELSCVHTGPEGLARAGGGGVDAVILDVMLPGMDGLDVLKALRRASDVPVLMLTARGDETDRVVGIEMGADDYLPKPFSTRELLARLRAIVRRSAGRTEKAGAVELPLIAGDLCIDCASRTVTLAGRALDLTRIEYVLLESLVRAAGRVLSRDQLLDRVAGREYEVFDRSIDVHISSLRRKLRDDPKDPRFIKTVRSAGYLFVESGRRGH